MTFTEALDMLEASPEGFVEETRRNPAILQLRWNGSETLLHWLSVERQYAKVTLLARLGADINALKRDGGTPLHDAILGNDIDGVVLLLQLGADPRIRNAAGCTAREWAGYVKASTKIRKLLESQGD